MAAPDAASTAIADRFRVEPHRCFACGELNEHGLRIRLHADGQRTWTSLRLDPGFQGWDGVAHGGIVCTLLDEVMAWAVIGRGTWGVTARLAVQFRQPVETGREIRAVGWVTELHRRLIRTAGEVRDVASGQLLATAEATFMAVPPDQLAELQARYRPRLEAEPTGRVAGGEESGPEASGAAASGGDRS